MVILLYAIALVLVLGILGGIIEYISHLKKAARIRDGVGYTVSDATRKILKALEEGSDSWKQVFGRRSFCYEHKSGLKIYNSSSVYTPGGAVMSLNPHESYLIELRLKNLDEEIDKNRKMAITYKARTAQMAAQKEVERLLGE